jgi:RsmE family RNA methyltransferase
MNLLLLFPGDFVAEGRAVITGRRLEHVRSIHRASAGDVLVAGMAGGMIGTAVVRAIDAAGAELEVRLERAPPPPLPLTLVLALPRPKVLNRVIAAATSIGIKRIALMNAWRVEKSYWESPRLSDENLHRQCILGLEQGMDTVLPVIERHRFFRSFCNEVLPGLVEGSRVLVASPGAAEECPRGVDGPVTAVVGPEGGWIDAELESLRRAGCTLVSIGERVLRVETAVAALAGRLF